MEAERLAEFMSFMSIKGCLASQADADVCRSGLKKDLIRPDALILRLRDSTSLWLRMKMKMKMKMKAAEYARNSMIVMI